MKAINLLIFTIFLTILSFSSYGQSKDFLLLKRGSNTKTQIRFYIGEPITYKSSKLGYYITDVIKDLNDNYIYLSENILSPDDILEIDIRRKDPRNSTLRNMNALVLGSGVILLGVESINSIYQTGEFSIDRGVGVIGGILTGTGLALLPIRYKTFKNQGRNRIQIIQMRLPD
ncbi:hypothetical protein [Algoriphagus algorifonticola]|uniref:hypothetical protein n=1 Tax=Algoriphagus algorifonticola TaxID=2593007 RepID=UPI0011A97D4B|nr:hypothetical protein [Algoriphagus algorifonticola]